MRRRERNSRVERQILWIRWLTGTLAAVGVLLLLFIGSGSILSEGEPGMTIGLGHESATTAQDMTDADAQEEPRIPLPTSESADLLAPSVPTAPRVDFDISASQQTDNKGDSTATDSAASGIATRGERIDLEQIRNRLQSGERSEDTKVDPGWEHEIAVGRRGSLRIGYEPAGGSEARDPLSGTLDAEFVVDLFGQASVSAGYRFLNFRDLDGNQELRDALARAQVQVRF